MSSAAFPCPPSDHIVILGTGIIGLSTAYYLSSHSNAVHPSSITLIDASPTLFTSASGKAGGFLGADWFASPVAALGKLSFDEHKRLADSEGGRERWGYSPTRVWNYNRNYNGGGDGKKQENWWWRDDGGKEIVGEKWKKEGPRWLTRRVGDDLEIVSGEGRSAQVDPKRLCNFLLQQCLSRGIRLLHPANAISVSTNEQNILSSIRILNTSTNSEHDLPCTKLILTSGPWTPQVFRTLFPSSELHIPISSLAGYSLVLRSPRWTDDDEVSDQGCSAVFTSDDQDASYYPEVFARVGGEIFIAGLNAPDLELPDVITGSADEIDGNAITGLRRLAMTLLSSTHNSIRQKNDDEMRSDPEVVRKSLCFRPVTEKGTPILSRIEDRDMGGVRTRGLGEGGVWVCAGHGPWGISLSLGSGKVLAELIQGEEASVDVNGLRL